MLVPVYLKLNPLHGDSHMQDQETPSYREHNTVNTAKQIPTLPSSPCLSGVWVVGAAAEAGKPRLPSSQQLRPLLPGGS